MKMREISRDQDKKLGVNNKSERGPELINTSKGRSTVTPLRPIDRAMGGNSSKGLDLGGGNTYYVNIVGANKSAKQLFEEIENYKRDMERNKGRRNFKNE